MDITRSRSTSRDGRLLRATSPSPSPVRKASSKSLAKRFTAVFADMPKMVCIAFWLFGLINNVLYVVILSAALDLVGPDLPKGMVLLFDVMPSFLTKLLSPYFIHLVPYRFRILIFFLLSTLGMQCVAFSTSISWRMFGVVLASIASGAGELTFLALTHYYDHWALAAWSSGTGGAGIAGGGLYLALTTWWGLGVKKSLIVLGFLPVVMLVSFFVILPRDPLNENKETLYMAVEEDQGFLNTTDDEETFAGHGPQFSAVNAPATKIGRAMLSLRTNLKRSQKLFFPYMLPLLLVYISEYTINQGVAPTLLYPISQMPFKNYREAYPTYNTIYQTGVFISRSSTPFIRVKHLYPPSVLQFVNLAILASHAVWNFIPSIYIIFAIIFWEGILGGLVYVNTFAEITDNVPHDEREFSLAATTVSDSGGVCIAGFISMGLETWLCAYQVRHGRDYCKLT